MRSNVEQALPSSPCGSAQPNRVTARGPLACPSTAPFSKSYLRRTWANARKSVILRRKGGFWRFCAEVEGTSGFWGKRGGSCPYSRTELFGQKHDEIEVGAGVGVEKVDAKCGPPASGEVEGEEAALQRGGRTGGTPVARDGGAVWMASDSWPAMAMAGVCRLDMDSPPLYPSAKAWHGGTAWLNGPPLWW